MRNLSQSTIGTIACIAMIAGAIGIWKALGYSTVYSMYDAERRAEEIVQAKRPASDCMKIRTFFPTYPPLAHFQSGCVRQYASLTKDPSACELLMPSEYGWNCLGGAMETFPCLFDFKDPPELRGNGIIVPLEECKSGTANIKNNSCCSIARVAFFGEEKSCSELTVEQPFIDQCFYELAKMKKDPDLCESIHNKNIGSACRVAMRALKQ